MEDNKKTKVCKNSHFTHNICEEGYRYCIKCEEKLPLNREYFYRDKKDEKGFLKVCINCLTGKNIENFSIEKWYDNKGNVFKGNWTLDEITWIYNNYLNITKQELLEHFKYKETNYKTLTNIIYQWNMKKIEKNDVWSDEDIEFLIANYPNTEQEELEKHFKGRTWVAIKGKGSKLGICRDDETLFKINSESHKGYVMPEERKREMSRRSRGANNHNWKGGLSPIVPYFRGILYEWKLDSLKEYDFKCALSGENNSDLEIHHINKNFSEMIEETFIELNIPKQNTMVNYTKEELELISKTFLEINYKYGLGIPLKTTLHKLFHILYGKDNNTKEQFEEFIEKYFNGEYDEKLKVMEENLKLSKPKKRKTYKKLKKEQVVDIKKYIANNFPDRYIAKLFDVSETAISNIRNNRTWKEVS